MTNLNPLHWLERLLERQLEKLGSRLVRAIERAGLQDSADWRAVFDRPQRYTVVVLGEFLWNERAEPFLVSAVRDIAHAGASDVTFSFHRPVKAGALLVSINGATLEHVRVGDMSQNWLLTEGGRGPIVKLSNEIPIGVTLGFRLSAVS